MFGKNLEKTRSKKGLCGVPFSSPTIVQNEHFYKILLTKKFWGNDLQFWGHGT